MVTTARRRWQGVLLGAALCLAWGLALGWGMPPYGQPQGPPFGPYAAPPQGAQPGQPPAQAGAPRPPQAPMSQGQAPQAQGAYPRAGYPQGAYPQTAWPQAPWGQPPAQGPYGMPPQGIYPGMQPQPTRPGAQVQPGAAPYQYRPVAPDNARGVPPAPAASPGPGYPMSGQPGWPGGYGQPQPARARGAPRLEWSLSETRPYVQQNLILRLRLISGDTLTTADPVLDASGDALLAKIDGPSSTTRNAGDGRREVVTEFALILTPLRAGDIELPAPKITGTRPGSYGRGEAYEAVAAEPVRLQVRPAMASVRPWLPLRTLTLDARVDHAEEVRPGQPVSLALEITATGGDAAQLPSLEDQLRGQDFRVYREQTLTDTELVDGGRTLGARRTEYYTLVPQTGGNIRLPEIAVPWWDLGSETRQVARLPIRTLAISGSGSPFSLPRSLTDTEGWGSLWLPVAALLLILAGYWMGVLYKQPAGDAGTEPRASLRSRARTGLATARGAFAAWLAERGRRLHPAPLASWARQWTLGALPDSSRLLRAVRYANQAQTPADWCERFEQVVRAQLEASAQVGSPSMTERMLRLRPRADRARVRRLMEQLDSALYGRQDLDFPRWKRELMAQLGRGSGWPRRRGGPSRIRRTALPELNPRAS